MIGARLDLLEGLRPDLDEGVYSLEEGKSVTTDPKTSFYKWDGSDDQISNQELARESIGLGTISTQDSDNVVLTGGEIQDVLIKIADHNETVIHTFPISFLGQMCEWFGFY